MQIENDIDLRGIKRIGEICGLTLKLMLDQAEPGMSTRDLDDIGRDFLTKTGAISAPIHAYGFPGYTCISLNDEAAHGIPRKDRRIRNPAICSTSMYRPFSKAIGAIPVPPSSCHRRDKN